jgi:hypothetical protein
MSDAEQNNDWTWQVEDSGFAPEQMSLYHKFSNLNTVRALSIQNTGSIYVMETLATIQCPRVRVKSTSSINQSYFSPTQIAVYQTDTTHDVPPSKFLGCGETGSSSSNSLSLVTYPTTTIGSVIGSRAKLTLQAPSFDFQIPGTSTSSTPLNYFDSYN